MSINLPKEELIELRNKGLTLSEIGKQFGCSSASISKKVKEYGLAGTLPKISKEDILSYIKTGQSRTECANGLNCSPSTISRWKTFYGIEELWESISYCKDKEDKSTIGSKTCTSCNEEKSLLEFNTSGFLANNRKKYKSLCRKCENINVKTTFDQKILKSLESQDRRYECEICGYKENSAALHFHHYTGEKNFAISKGNYKTFEDLDYEIFICQVLCANCHIELHNPHLTLK